MFNVGDRVRYVRNKDGSTVAGVIAEVHHRQSDRSRFMFNNESLSDETTAYSLSFDAETKERVRHPVTVGASRATAATS